MTGTTPIHDPARLAAVRATGLLDTAPEEPFDRLARLAALVLDAPFAFVTVVDQTRSFWKSRIGVEGNVNQNTVEESFCQYVVATDDAVIVNDAANDPRTRDNPSIESMGVAAWAGFPLHAPGGEVLGSFCVVDTVVRQWGDRDFQVLESLAKAAGDEVTLRMTAVAASAASDAARAGQGRLTFLSDVSEALATTADAEAAVGDLAQLVVPYLADWSLICLVDEATGERRDIGRAHRDPDVLPAVNRYADLHRPASTSPIPTAIRTGEAVTIAHVDEALLRRSLPDPAALAAIKLLAPDSVAVLPLRGRTGKAFGAVTLYNLVERGAHTPDELRLAQEMTRRAGLILENARLQARERGVAEVLQRSLLTRPPVIEGVELEVRYRPAGEGSRVGGDWYDAFLQPDGSLVLVIGDIVGHDMAAVGVMGQVRTMTRSIAYDRAASPAQTLRRVDDAIGGLDVAGLCTAIVVHLERGRADERGVPFTWSSAGHPPMLVVSPDGSEITVDAEPELMLGVQPDAARTDHEAVLPRGATMLLMTDGLFERRDMDFDESFALLRGSLSQLADRPVDVLCDRLLATMAAEVNVDDIALVAIRISV